MIKPINIYAISRIRDEEAFNLIESHQSQKECKSSFKKHEIKSLKILSDSLYKAGVKVNELDCFFWGFTIPQIGKEFDLLKITDKLCLNIELKSEMVSEESISKQLFKNRHYLMHTGKKLSLFCIVTSSMECYKITDEGELIVTDFSEIVKSVVEHHQNSFNQIDELFRPSSFLVSPINTPEKFLNDDYFLTNQQDSFKKEILKLSEQATSSAFFHISGRAGTGKTLLLYDIAKTYSKSAKTIIIHCGKTSEGQNVISEIMANLSIVHVIKLKERQIDLSDYS